MLGEGDPLQLARNHCEAVTPSLESGAPHFCDKIIKSTDTRGRRKVRSHDFPDFTPGQDTPGELPFKRMADFTPAAFYTNQDAAGSAKGPSASHASRAGIQGQAAAGDGTPMRHLLHLVQQALVSMEGAAEELDHAMERAVGLLALRLAEIMVNHTTETTSDVVLSNLSRALQKGQGQTIRKIRVNPVDMKPVAANRDSLSGLVGHMQDLPLKGDAALFRGGCVIETDYGTIDATPENQFRVLRDAFRSVIGSLRSG
jgi:flagellar biosynthesis/type III secretory pathway protein FliH